MKINVRIQIFLISLFAVCVIGCSKQNNQPESKTEGFGAPAQLDQAGPYRPNVFASNGNTIAEVGKPIPSTSSLGTKPGIIRRKLTPSELEEMKAAGYDVTPVIDKVVEIPVEFDQGGQQAQSRKSAAASDLKNAVIYMDSFLGMSNALILADVISMNVEALKFQYGEQHYDYSGHYTVMLKTPRKHKNPLLGFGSPAIAKFIILDRVGGNSMPLASPTIWEKGAGFIDVEAAGVEWIHSGTYSIQN